MAWTRAQLAPLETAMRSGVLSVSNGGKTVTYGSFADLKAAYEYALAQVIASETSAPARPRNGGIVRLTQTGTGL